MLSENNYRPNETERLLPSKLSCVAKSLADKFLQKGTIPAYSVRSRTDSNQQMISLVAGPSV